MVICRIQNEAISIPFLFYAAPLSEFYVLVNSHVASFGEHTIEDQFFLRISGF